MSSILERLRKPPSQDIRGDLSQLSVAILRGTIPRLEMPQLPIDERVVQSMREATKRGVRNTVIVFSNLPEALITAAKEGVVTIWYTPKQTCPYWVGDGKDVFWINPDGSATSMKNSYFKVRSLQYQLNELPRVRILPGEVDELSAMISGCKQIIGESAPGTILEELNRRSLHPVDIFNHFAERRGLKIP